MNIIGHDIFLDRQERLKKIPPLLLFVRKEEENKRLRDITIRKIYFKFLLGKLTVKSKAIKWNALFYVLYGRNII